MTNSAHDLALRDLLDFGGRSVVITGGARGIGQACAQRFVEAGARVWVADLNPPASTDNDVSVQYEELDATDADSVEQFAAQIVDMSGHLDVWVNSAGVFPRADVLDIAPAEWRRVMDANTLGALVSSQAAARAMSRVGGGGAIVNVASTVAFRVMRNAAHYRASKAALLALTQNLAAELGPQGVRALAVCPTVTTTEGLAELTDGRDLCLDKYVKRLPLGRAATPDDVARVVLFAASPMAAFMTGSALLVDGGEVAS